MTRARRKRRTNDATTLVTPPTAASAPTASPSALPQATPPPAPVPVVPAAPTSGTLAHVHETDEAVAVVEMTPPHPPRTETPEYAAAHKFLTRTKNAPCEVCGVTNRTLKNAAKNPFGAKALETHHFPIERSLADACDPRKVHLDFPQVYNRETLMAFVDSPANLKVLCDVHHRSVAHGIHHLLPQDFAVQKYLYTGYVIAASQKDASAVEAADEALLKQVGPDGLISPAA